MYTRKFSQLVYIALNITIYCLHIYKHLLYFLCVQILICTNRTECHWTRITGEANTCKQRARWAPYGDGTQNRGKGSITKWVTAEFEFSERHPNPSSPLLLKEWTILNKNVTIGFASKQAFWLCINCKHVCPDKHCKNWRVKLMGNKRPIQDVLSELNSHQTNTFLL